MSPYAAVARRSLALAACLCVLAGPGRAELPPQATQRMDAAYGAMTTLLAQARPTGTPPRLSDPASRPALTAMWDVPGLLGAPPYRSGDTPGLVNVLVKELDILKAYLYFTADPAQPGDPDRNSFTYQDEVIRFEVLLVQVFPATLEAVGDLTVHLSPAELTPTRKAGLARSRAGVVQSLGGWATTVQDANLRADNRALLVDSMARVGARLAPQLPVADRQTILASLRPAVDGLSAAQKAAMAPVLAAFAATSCEGACAIQ